MKLYAFEALYSSVASAGMELWEPRPGDGMAVWKRFVGVCEGRLGPASRSYFFASFEDERCLLAGSSLSAATEAF